jgi:hypothetical protein
MPRCLFDLGGLVGEGVGGGVADGHAHHHHRVLRQQLQDVRQRQVACSKYFKEKKRSGGKWAVGRGGGSCTSNRKLY